MWLKVYLIPFSYVVIKRILTLMSLQLRHNVFRKMGNV